MATSKYTTLDVKRKTLKINLDPGIYGTVAEIGAGQEVARSFFQAGGASGTVAKTISAYDMTMSDAIYGDAPKRYVCLPRLDQMLDYEFDQLTTTLASKQKEKKFFAFADTVEAINYSRTNRCHGWMGVRFQDGENEEFNEVVIHIRMLDNDNPTQQQAIGMLGINLIYGCYFHSNEPKTLITSLMDNFAPGRIQIDMVRFTGPVFKNVDNRLMSLFLVKSNYADAVMFTPEGTSIHPTELLYKKDILALRGRFRPVTHVHMDMLENSKKMFEKDPKVDPKKVVCITEITLDDLSGSDDIDEKDFLDRVDLLGELGQTVLISNFQEYYKLATYLTRYNTGAQIGIVLGANSLINIFNDKYYKKLNGGLLEAFGQLFHKDVRLYLYPYKFRKELITTDNMLIPDNYDYLFKYLISNGKIIDFDEHNAENLHIFSHKVLELIEEGKDWESLVPKRIAIKIKEQELFKYKAKLIEK